MKPTATARAGRSRDDRASAPRLRDRLATVLAHARDVPEPVLRDGASPAGRAYGERRDGFAIRLPGRAPGVSFARNDLSRWLRKRGFGGPELFEIALACSEIVANAVEHPRDRRRRTIEVGAVLGERELMIVVRNIGRWSRQPQTPDRGRGLMLARRLMDDVEIDQHRDGTSVTMVRRTAG